MSKWFLKTIGFVALLIFVSHIIPPSAVAMMRTANWREYDENENLRKTVQTNANDIGQAQLQARNKSIYRVEHRWKCLQVQTSLRWWQKWYVCEKEPFRHTAQFITDMEPNEHGYTNEERPTCKTCELGSPHENDC